MHDQQVTWKGVAKIWQRFFRKTTGTMEILTSSIVSSVLPSNLQFLLDFALQEVLLLYKNFFKIVKLFYRLITRVGIFVFFPLEYFCNKIHFCLFQVRVDAARILMFTYCSRVQPRKGKRMLQSKSVDWLAGHNVLWWWS